MIDFKIDIRISGIPNAGQGAYLTYLGARVLKPYAKARSSKLLPAHVAHDDIETLKPLPALTKGGSQKISVTLTGKNLHRNGNR